LPVTRPTETRSASRSVRIVIDQGEYSAIPPRDFTPPRKSLTSGTEKLRFSPPGPSIDWRK